MPFIKTNDGVDPFTVYYKYSDFTCVHREDGPAIIHDDGDAFWYQNNVRHREGGPAIEYADGDKHWFIAGIEYTEKEYWRQLKFKAFK